MPEAKVAEGQLLYTSKGLKALNQVRIGDEIVCFTEKSALVRDNVVDILMLDEEYEVVTSYWACGPRLVRLKLTPDSLIKSPTFKWKEVRDFQQAQYAHAYLRGAACMVTFLNLEEARPTRVYEVKTLQHNSFVVNGIALRSIENAPQPPKRSRSRAKRSRA